MPSSITVRIRQLEEDLGCELFLRERQGMILSLDGRRLLEHALEIVDLTARTRGLLRGEETLGKLTVGALDVVLVSYMPGLIGAFRRKYPSIPLDVRSEASEVLVAQVSEGILDVALTDGPIQSKTLASSPAFTDDMVLVTALDHPPVRRAQDLRCAELYGFRHDCSFRFRMDRWLGQDGMDILPVVEIESYHTMLACVSAGMGAAWVLRSVLQTLPGCQQVRAHSLGAAGNTEIHFVWRIGHLSQSAQRLIAMGSPLQ